MDKQQFNNLEIIEQKNYINDRLLEMSLTKVCEALGVNRSTISKRFKSIGFTFDKSVNQYQLADTTEVQQNSNQYVTIEQYKALENRIKALEDAYKKLNTTEVQQQNNNGATEVQQKSNYSATEVQQNSNSNTIRFYKNDVVVRAYRIDEEIYRRFKAYTDDNKQYKISDIISTAMEDFLNKYSK